MISSALAYAARGWHVFPVWGVDVSMCRCPKGEACERTGKHPITSSGKDDATTSAERIRGWWQRHPHANIGIAVQPSGIQVLDVDGAAGHDSLAALGELPVTMTARTGSGGLHFVFARGSDRPRQEIKIRPGLDLIGKGYIIVAPSVHVSGGIYVWEHDCDPVPVPDVIRELRRVQKPSTGAGAFERARAYLARIPGAVSGQSGHTQTFMAATAMAVGFDLGEADALSILTTDYNPRCDPPWSASELRHKVVSAIAQSKRERGYLLDRPQADIGSAPVAVADSKYPDGLLRGNTGNPRKGYHNTALYVLGHPQWSGRWSFDEMVGQPCLDGKLLSPTTIGEIRAATEVMLGYSPPVADIESAVLAASMRRPFHPVRRYLSDLIWDGAPRLASIASTELGSPTPVAAAMIRKWAISAVARAFEPGSKVDTCLVLQGDQGMMKSTFFSALGGDWFSDTYVDMSSRDSLIQISTAWIYELGEIDQVLSGRNEERFKGWLASTHDTYRAPYERVATRRARSCVIVGTANPEEFLRDATGNRRYWIVRVTQRIEADVIRGLRDQLWAEAVCAYEAGEQWWLTEEEEAERSASNETHREHDPWETVIGDYLGSPTAPREVTISDLLGCALRIEIGKQGRWEQMRVGRILRWAGWTRRRSTRTWVYVAPIDGPVWPVGVSYEAKRIN